MKRTVKKLGLLMAVIMLALAAFAGCAGPAAQNSIADADNTATPAAQTSAPAKTPEATPAESGAYTIGITQIVEHPSLDRIRQGIIDKLSELGYAEGDDFRIDYKSAQNDMAVATTISQQFVADKVDAIVAIATPTAQAAYAASMGNIPLIFSAVSEPVAAELCNADGTNIAGVTGTSDKLPVEPMFELIKQMVPDAVKVGILHSTGEVNSDIQLAEAKEKSGGYGLEIVDVGITSTNEMASALDTLLPQVDVVMNLTDNTVVSALALEVQKCNEKKIPLFGSEDTQVAGGALASAGLDYYALGQNTGAMVAEVLDGKKAEEIPILTSAQAMITVSAEQAEFLGLTVPDELKANILSPEASK
jgi:putative ABC transport system substrate-binding protein